jgi:Tol biopolymer transport system component
MKQKIWRVPFIALVVVFLFSACSEQQPQPTPEMTKTVTTSSTAQPTGTRAPIQTRTTTPTTTPKTQASDLCAKNPVPAKLLLSKPSVENNRLIAFSTERHSDIYWNYSDVYTVNFDGTGRKKITNYSGNDNMGWWSDDGKQIFFYSDRYQKPCTEYGQEVGCGLELFMMNVDGSGSRKVTPDLPYYPDRSPDGKYLVYENSFYDELRLQHGLGDFLSDIFVTNISGSYKRNITGKFQPGGFSFIDWNPDSKHFVFEGVTDPAVYTDLSTGDGYWKRYAYLVNADGSGLQKLPSGPFRSNGSAEVWSPDGKRLAFLTAKGIGTINADGSGFLEYSIEQNFGEREVFWLDDGEHLIFTDANENYYKIKTDFTELEKISFATDVDRLLFLFDLLKTQSLWDDNKEKILSPDGKWIAYFDCYDQISVTSVETKESYFVIDDQAAGKLTVDDMPIYPFGFSHALLWSPDSQQLLFTETLNVGVIIHMFDFLFAVKLDGTGLRLIAQNVQYPEIQP